MIEREMSMKKVGNIIIWVAVLAILIIGAYVVYNRSDSEEYIEDKIAGDIDGDINKDGTADNKDGGTEEENKIMAPDFTLKDLDGNTVKLSDYRGKIVFLNFWASWCGPCRTMGPVIAEAATALAPAVRVAKLDTEAETALAARFAIRSIPTLAIFRRGALLQQRSGAMPLPQLLASVRQVVAADAGRAR